MLFYSFVVVSRMYHRKKKVVLICSETPIVLHFLRKHAYKFVLFLLLFLFSMLKYYLGIL